MSESRARALFPVVALEAVGSSITPFVPVPFVDDWLFERLLRRIAHKVAPSSSEAEAALVTGYVKAGSSPLHERAITTAARFIVRKLAVVLDVKRSHDVFGEAIAFAFAVDIAGQLGAAPSAEVGAAIFRATQALGSAAIEVITHASRAAFAKTEGASASRFGRVATAIGAELDTAYARLDHLLRYELVASRQG